MTWKSTRARAGIASLIVAGAYLALLAVPGPLFGYVARLNNITVYSDQPIPAAVTAVLADAQLRLRNSPLNDTALQHRVYICNRYWRFLLFTNTDHGAGGVNRAWLNRNIFLRRCDIEKNSLIGPSGKPASGDRTLAYFMAHEITHSLEVHHLGRYAYLRLPAWKREGYADYVARASSFRFPENLEAYKRGADEMEPKRSGLYLRYCLFVTYLLDFGHLSPSDLLTQQAAEAEIDRRLRMVPLLP